MPRRDGTGPQGMGENTGRGFGACEDGAETPARGAGRGRGAGKGRRCGAGKGRGRGLGVCGNPEAVDKEVPTEEPEVVEEEKEEL